MNAKNKILKTGKWYHKFKVPAAIFITERGSNKSVLYYVQYEAIGEPGTMGSEAGPFHSVKDALAHARKSTNGTLRWS